MRTTTVARRLSKLMQSARREAADMKLNWTHKFHSHLCSYVKQNSMTEQENSSMNLSELKSETLLQNQIIQKQMKSNLTQTQTDKSMDSTFK
jgi:hypothetical protein